MTKLPYISDEIIEFLEKLYPERSADPTWSERELWMKSGQRVLVRKLIDIRNDQLRRSITKD